MLFIILIIVSENILEDKGLKNQDIRHIGVVGFSVADQVIVSTRSATFIKSI